MTAPPWHPLIVMNPRSGGGTVQRLRLVEKAARLGATVLLLDKAIDDLAARLRQAVDDDVDLIGVAAGDGTIAIVADVAAEHGVPLLVIPAGTRNHFAMDLGLDRSHPSKALEALADGEEVTVDLGTAGGRCFVNNVSFGAYAEIVKRPDYRDNKLRVTLDVLPDVLAGRAGSSFTVRAGGLSVTNPHAAIISNNPYAGGEVGGITRRPRLDTGQLGLICVELEPPPPPLEALRDPAGHRLIVTATAAEVIVEATEPIIPVGLDGESVALATPVRCRIRPGALRVRLPRTAVQRPARRRVTRLPEVPPRLPH